MNLDPPPPERPAALPEWCLSVLPWVPVSIAMIPIGIVAACQLRAVHESQNRSALIRDLAGQGLTAPEIEHLVDSRAREDERVAYNKAQYLAVEADLRRHLSAHKLSADDIQLILRTWSGRVAVPGRYSCEAVDAARKEAEWVKEALQRGRSPKDVAALLGTPLREGGPVSVHADVMPKAE